MTTRRYEALLKIASGGTAAVYVGSAAGALGFRQLVAIKRPHAHLADDPAFCAALVEEARIASRLHHANVVDVRDVEVDERGIQLVMDYVEGASLSELIRAWVKEPPPERAEAVALRIMLDACEGLRALHELAGDDGAPLGLVHRDVSPANILVGLDGVARIADFGLAKSLLAVERTTSEGALRGKLGYMAPEYIRGKAIDRRVDLFALGVVLWEVLARKRLFRGENDGDTLERVQTFEAPPLASVAPRLGEGVASALDDVITAALAKDPERRFSTVDAFSAALEKAVRSHDLGASHGDVRDAFAPSLRAALDDRRRRVQAATPAPSPSQPPIALDAPSQPPIALGAAATPRSTPPRAGVAPRVPRALVAVAALGLIALLVTGLVVVVSARDSSASRSATPRTLVQEREPLSGDVRGQATPSPSTSTASATHAPHGVARPSARPASDEPGKKPPRPNPYASSPLPR
jgi:eukaryotic-like serine/threonine-protein kinase